MCPAILALRTFFSQHQWNHDFDYSASTSNVSTTVEIISPKYDHFNLQSDWDRGSNRFVWFARYNAISELFVAANPSLVWHDSSVLYALLAFVNPNLALCLSHSVYAVCLSSLVFDWLAYKSTRPDTYAHLYLCQAFAPLVRQANLSWLRLVRTRPVGEYGTTVCPTARVTVFSSKTNRL